MFEWVTGTIRSLGYAGVAGLTFLENLFPPIPSELVIPLAGYVAAGGDLGIRGVIAAATFGSLAGAALWYWIGLRVGERRLRAWVKHSGKWLTLSDSDLDRAKDWFERRGGGAVFLGRLVPGVRTFVSLPAGFAKMPLLPFLLYSAAGTLIWTTALAYAGVILKSQFTLVKDYINVASYVVLAAFLILLGRRYVRCWTARHS